MSRFSIFIVTWNNQDIIETCLNSITEIGSSGETIIVDNGSSDKTVEIIQSKYPWVRIVRSAYNLGFAKANNQVVKLTAGEYILLLNSDAYLMEDSIKVLMSYMDANPMVGISGPMLVSPSGDPQKSFSAFPSISYSLLSLLHFEKIIGKLKGAFKSAAPDVPFEVDYISGASMFIRRSVVDEIGLFDEDYFFYGEDADFCQRAKKAGWRVHYVPEARVIHLGGGSSSKKYGYKYLPRLHEAQLKFVKKHRNAMYVSAWACIMVLVMWLRLAYNRIIRLMHVSSGSRNREDIAQKVASLGESVNVLKRGIWFGKR